MMESDGPDMTKLVSTEDGDRNVTSPQHHLSLQCGLYGELNHEPGAMSLDNIKASFDLNTISVADQNMGADGTTSYEHGGEPQVSMPNFDSKVTESPEVVESTPLPPNQYAHSPDKLDGEHDTLVDNKKMSGVLSASSVADHIEDSEDQTTNMYSNHSGETQDCASTFTLRVNESYGIVQDTTITNSNNDDELPETVHFSKFTLQVNESQRHEFNYGEHDAALDNIETSNNLNTTSVADQVVDDTDHTMSHNYSSECQHSTSSFAVQGKESHGVVQNTNSKYGGEQHNDSLDFALQSNESYGINEDQGTSLDKIDIGGNLVYCTSAADQVVGASDQTTYHNYSGESQDSAASNFALQSYGVVQSTSESVMNSNYSGKPQDDSSYFAVQTNESYGVNEEHVAQLDTVDMYRGNLMSTSVADQVLNASDQRVYHNYSVEPQDSISNPITNSSYGDETQHGSSAFVLHANESYGVNEEQGSPLETGGDLTSTSIRDHIVDTNDPATYNYSSEPQDIAPNFVLQANELVQGTPSPPNVAHSPTHSHDDTTSSYDSISQADSDTSIYEVVQDVQLSTSSEHLPVGMQVAQLQLTHNSVPTTPLYDSISQTDSPPSYMEAIQYEIVDDSPVHYDTIPGHTQQHRQAAVITTPSDTETDQPSDRDEESDNLQLMIARCACIGVPLCCVLVLGTVSLVLTWVADVNSANYILTIPLVASIIIIGVVGLPAGICCLRLQSDNSLRSRNLFKFTFYVAVLTAGPIAFVGTFSAGLLQIFFMTSFKDENRIFDSPTLGGNAAAVNLLAAILCIIMVTTTFIVCIKDPSRKCSNGCVRAFVLMILLLVSNISACVLTFHCVVLSIISDGIHSDHYVFIILAAVLGGGATHFLTIGVCFVGPLVCYEEGRKSIHLARDSSIMVIILSLLTLGNAIAGALLIVPGSSLQVDPNENVNQSSFAAKLVFVGVMNFVVTVISVFAFCIGCYHGVLPQFNINGILSNFY